jgi:hypothetical protein
LIEHRLILPTTASHFTSKDTAPLWCARSTR